METVYVNIKDNHFKVWGCDCFSSDSESEVITYWGRIGVPMQRLQKNRKKFGSFAEASGYVMRKVREKRAKGYESMPNHVYFGAVLDGTAPQVVIRHCAAREA
jgi:predicted DNA-binding WGR domain protein